MAKVLPSIAELPVSQSQQEKMFLYAIRKAYELSARIINGRISFGDGTNSDNIDGVWASVTTPSTPNTDFTVTHNLGRIPIGYLVVKKTASVDIYDGSVAFTTTQMTLRATIASVSISLFIF